MFQLTNAEAEALRCQIGTSKSGRGGRRYKPLAFTGQRVAMLSGVFRSPRALPVNVAPMRAPVKLREIRASHRDLAIRLDEMERKYSGQFRAVFGAIRELMKPPDKPRRGIGFRSNGKA